MTGLVRLLAHRRMAISGALLLAATGLTAWATMPRQEDPVLRDYWGQIVVAFPGADAETVERAWDDVRDALDEARRELPSDPGEQVTIELDDPAARRLGLDPRRLAAELAARNTSLLGGALHAGGYRIALRPETGFRSIEEIRATPLALPGGGVVPLGSIAEVRHGPAEPTSALMRWNRRTAVGLGIVARPGQNLIDFGRAVRVRMADLAPSVSPLEVDEVIFQPDQVETRLADLGRSLLYGMLIVAGILLATMGGASAWSSPRSSPWSPCPLSASTRFGVACSIRSRSPLWSSPWECWSTTPS